MMWLWLSYILDLKHLELTLVEFAKKAFPARLHFSTENMFYTVIFRCCSTGNLIQYNQEREQKLTMYISEKKIG